MNNTGYKSHHYAWIGRPAPDFVLTAENGDKWSLADQAGKVTVLLFYPKNETLVCTKQMCSVRDHWSEYLDTKASIVGISPGTPAGHREFSSRHGLPINLLADSDRKVTAIFGSHWLYPINFTRAIVVVDAKGTVRSRQIMLRAFRPKDSNVIRSIYAARGDALMDHYNSVSNRFKKLRSE